jgi:hypothetical protein
MQHKPVLYIFLITNLILLSSIATINCLPKIVAQPIETNSIDRILKINMEHNPILVASNSTTKIIPVVQSTNEKEIKSLMLYSIDLSPSPELNNTINEIVDNGTSSRPCIFDETIDGATGIDIECSTNPTNTTVIWDIFKNDKSQWIIDLQNINILNIENHTKVFPAIASSD